jgi:hypothetical protein
VELGHPGRLGSARSARQRGGDPAQFGRIRPYQLVIAPIRSSQGFGLNERIHSPSEVAEQCELFAVGGSQIASCCREIPEFRTDRVHGHFVVGSDAPTSTRVRRHSRRSTAPALRAYARSASARRTSELACGALQCSDGSPRLRANGAGHELARRLVGGDDHAGFAGTAPHEPPRSRKRAVGEQPLAGADSHGMRPDVHAVE